jgi:hypothetical protein
LNKRLGYVSYTHINPFTRCIFENRN